MEATKKQLDYAYAIADYLGIERPKEKREIVEWFIQIHRKEYWDRINHRKLIDADYEYMKYKRGSFSREALINLEKILLNKKGLYCFLDSDKRVLYIGKSKNLYSRIPSSFSERIVNTEIAYVGYMLFENMADVNITEIMLIGEYKPVLNTESNSAEKSSMYESGIDIFKDFKWLQLYKTDDGVRRNVENFEEVRRVDNDKT